MKLFVGFFTLFIALFISGIAAYFSVVGLAAIFSATAGAVIIMGCALEAGKLTSAGWLHENWTNPKVNGLHKGYMVSAIAALMLITSLGIYGFLAKGHLEQQAPLAPIELQIAQKEARITQINADIARLTAQQSQTDSALNAVMTKDATKGLKVRGRLNTERRSIQNKIDAETAELNTLSNELVPLKLKVNEVETKLGPIKYIADLFGIKDTEGAVRIVILLLMFAFDPLAIVMVLSSVISISDGFEERRRNKLLKSMVIKTPVVEEPVRVMEDIEEVSEQLDDVTDNLEEVIEDIEEVISELNPEDNQVVIENLDAIIEDVGEVNDQLYAVEEKVEDIEEQIETDMVSEETEENDDETVISVGEGLGEMLSTEEGKARLEQYANWCLSEEGKLYFAQEAENPEEEMFYGSYAQGRPRGHRRNREDIAQSMNDKIETMSDKDHLFDILERKPELLQNIVEVIREQDESSNKTVSWLDDGSDK